MCIDSYAVKALQNVSDFAELANKKNFVMAYCLSLLQMDVKSALVSCPA